MYDNQIGRWMVIDPLSERYSGESPFTYAGNNPISNVDIEGKYKYPIGKSSQYAKDYPIFTNFLQNQVGSLIMRNGTITDAMIQDAGFKGGVNGDKSEYNLNCEKIEAAVTWGSGPNIIIVDDPGGNPNARGHYNRSTNTISLNKKWVQRLENASPEDQQAALLALYSTILHETVHYGDELDGQGADTYHPGEYIVQRALVGEWVDGYFGFRMEDLYDLEDAKAVIERKVRAGEGIFLPSVPSKKENKSDRPIDVGLTLMSFFDSNPNITFGNNPVAN